MPYQIFFRSRKNSLKTLLNRIPDTLKLHTLPSNSFNLHKVILYKCFIGDVEDPYIWAADPIMRWQDTEQGRWCLDNCEGDIVFHTAVDHRGLGYQVVIQGNLNDKNLTYFKLRWGDVLSHK